MVIDRGRIHVIQLLDDADSRISHVPHAEPLPQPFRELMDLLMAGADLRQRTDLWQLLDLEQVSPFRRAVWWTTFTQLGPGMVMTYAHIAQCMGRKPGLARAIGQALRHNPFPLLIPCHRVIAAHGWGGFMGQVAKNGGRKAAILAGEGYVTSSG